ncbi:MAG: glutathione S-transferase family protein [Polyangiaceae bacterium]
MPYLRIHPLGRVPALVDGDTVIFESIAICMYLADKYPEKKLAPAVGTPERGQYYQWMLFAASELEPPLVEYANHTQFLPAEKRNPEIAAAAKEKVLAAIKVVEHAMLGKMYLVAERLSAVDMVVGSLMRWAETMKLLEGAPDLALLALRIEEPRRLQEGQLLTPSLAGPLPTSAGVYNPPQTATLPSLDLQGLAPALPPMGERERPAKAGSVHATGSRLPPPRSHGDHEGYTEFFCSILGQKNGKTP